MNIYLVNAIKSNAKINCMSNNHDALKKLKLKAIEISKHQEGYKNQDTQTILKKKLSFKLKYLKALKESNVNIHKL